MLSRLFPSEDAAGIRDLVIASATAGVLDPATLGEGSPNLLLALPAADGLIFDDDFNGLGNWPINVEKGSGQNSACSGYCAEVESAADSAYLGDTRPDDEYIYRAAFRLLKEDLAFGPQSEVTLFRAQGAGDATLFEMFLETGPSGVGEVDPALKVVVQTHSGPVEALVELPAGALVDPTLQLEFEWVPSAFAAEHVGFFRLWSGLVALQNVELLVSLDDLDTHGLTVESALFGYRERGRNGGRRSSVLEVQVAAGGSCDIVLARPRLRPRGLHRWLWNPKPRLNRQAFGFHRQLAETAFEEEVHEQAEQANRAPAEDSPPEPSGRGVPGVLARRSGIVGRSLGGDRI